MNVQEEGDVLIDLSQVMQMQQNVQEEGDALIDLSQVMQMQQQQEDQVSSLTRTVSQILSKRLYPEPKDKSISYQNLVNTALLKAYQKIKIKIRGIIKIEMELELMMLIYFQVLLPLQQDLSVFSSDVIASKSITTSSSAKKVGSCKW